MNIFTAIGLAAALSSFFMGFNPHRRTVASLGLGFCLVGVIVAFSN